MHIENFLHLNVYGHSGGNLVHVRFSTILTYISKMADCIVNCTKILLSGVLIVYRSLLPVKYAMSFWGYSVYSDFRHHRIFKMAGGRAKLTQI